jgi:hypothetical protein
MDYGLGIGKGAIFADAFDGGPLGGNLATVHLPNKYDTAGKGFSEEAFDLADANARLIAAAPEMCDLLHKLIVPGSSVPVGEVTALLARIDGKE